MYKNSCLFNKIFCFLILLGLVNKIKIHYDFLIYIFLFLILGMDIKKNVLFIFSLAYTVICITGFYFNVPVIFGKLLTLIFLIMFFLLTISFSDKRYLLETLLYRNKGKNKLIKKIHYRNVYNYNKNLNKGKLKSYRGLKTKTDDTLREIFIKSKLRYYGFYKKRTNFVKDYIKKEDILMIIIVCVVALLLFI